MTAAFADLDDQGGRYEWDSAAPVAVATAAGLHVSRLDGTALRYNAEIRGDLSATDFGGHR